MATYTIASPIGPGAECPHCGHSFDPHVMVAVCTEPVVMGIVYCPVVGCECGSPWRAGTGLSTPEQIAETRRLVRETLRAHGCAVPPWLR